MTKIINPAPETSANIKVIGIGGSGRNAINHMINNKTHGVDFIAINTDTQDLVNCLAEKKIHIGKNLTRGLGAGMDPDVGRRAAEETREEITESIKGADMVFITGGFGGGTFTGASSVVANICKNEGILTIAVSTKPFFFEGNQRAKIAEEGIQELEKEVDALITISNDRLLSISEKSTTITEAFAMCDEILRQAVEGISEIIRLSGRMNLDFNDIKRILKDSGTALFGVGRATGDDRAIEAANFAIANPLLDLSINNATGLLYVVFGNEDLTLSETAEASKIITQSVSKDAKVIFGIYNDDTLKKDEIKITVIATGFPLDGINKSTINIEKKMQAKKVDTPQKKDNDEADIQEIDKLDTASIRNINTKPILTEDEDDDDTWNSLPSFLQRKKK
ncbi:MAG: cell division protein FtsZ [Candidatus Pacebacteria bacterium]|nr:cell division protein FtsZ [Candidatus Paceibacterota bacterium]